MRTGLTHWLTHGLEQNCSKTCSWDNHWAPWRTPVVHDESENARSWSSHHCGGRCAKNCPVAILNKELANDWFTSHAIFTYAKRNLPLRILSGHDFVGTIRYAVICRFLLHSWPRVMPSSMDNRNATNNWTHHYPPHNVQFGKLSWLTKGPLSNQTKWQRKWLSQTPGRGHQNQT